MSERMSNFMVSSTALLSWSQVSTRCSDDFQLLAHQSKASPAHDKGQGPPDHVAVDGSGKAYPERGQGDQRGRNCYPRALREERPERQGIQGAQKTTYT